MAVDHNTRVMRKAMSDLKDAERDIRKKLDTRQECNQEILKILKEIVDNNSAMRFCQILAMFDLDKDRFNEESIDTLQSIKNRLAEL